MKKALILYILLSQIVVAQVKPAEIATLDGHRRKVKSIGFTEDGKSLITYGDDFIVRKWDLKTKKLKEFPCDKFSAISPDGKFISAIDKDGYLTVYNTRKFTVYTKSKAPIMRPGKGAFISDYGEEAIITCRDSIRSDGKEDLYVLNLFEPNKSGIIRTSSAGNRKFSAKNVFNFSCCHILSDHHDNSLSIWTNDGIFIDTISKPSNFEVRAIVSSLVNYLPSCMGRLHEVIAYAIEDTIHIYNVTGGKLERTLTGHNGFINAIAWDKTRNYLVSGGNDNLIKVWDVKSGTCINTIDCNNPTAFAFSPDNKTLASSGGIYGFQIKLWKDFIPAVKPD